MKSDVELMRWETTYQSLSAAVGAAYCFARSPAMVRLLAYERNDAFALTTYLRKIKWHYTGSPYQHITWVITSRKLPDRCIVIDAVFTSEL